MAMNIDLKRLKGHFQIVDDSGRLEKKLCNHKGVERPN